MARGQAPGARVVKAFNTVHWEILRDKGDADAGDERLVVLVAGDDADAKQRVERLIEDIGFAPVDQGGLADGGRLHSPAPSATARCSRSARRCRHHVVKDRLHAPSGQVPRLVCRCCGAAPRRGPCLHGCYHPPRKLPLGQDYVLEYADLPQRARLLRVCWSRRRCGWASSAGGSTAPESRTSST